MGTRLLFSTMAGRATSAVGRVTLYGSNGSPYSIKVRSLMRYRRIAYTWQRLWQWLEDGGSVSEVRAVESQRMPLLRFDDGQLVQGSTNIALDLERRMATLARSVIPRDPATAFLVHLVEDYADEWWMKSAFAWRWILQDEKAVKMSAHHAVADILTPASREEVRSTARKFMTRQRLRTALMGVGDGTGVVNSMQRDLLAIEQHLESANRFLFGTRPSLADFAIHGQIAQLVVDGEPSSWLRENTPRLFAWALALEESSGIEGLWADLSDGVHPVVTSMLKNIGRYYLPYLVANAEAFDKGLSEFEYSLPGGDVVSQPPIDHQRESLKEIQGRYAGLSTRAKAKLEDILIETNTLPFLSQQTI